MTFIQWIKHKKFWRWLIARLKELRSCKGKIKVYFDYFRMMTTKLVPEFHSEIIEESEDWEIQDPKL